MEITNLYIMKLLPKLDENFTKIDHVGISEN